MSSSKLQTISASSSLPSEIIEAILSLLPLKSLGRFKCVSKTWNSLISDPQFIKKHLQRIQNTKLILLTIDFDSCTRSYYSLDTNQLLPYLLNTNNDEDDDIPATVKELSFRRKEVLGSCNGLVLAEHENSTMFLINFTTRERYEVPLNPFVPPGGDFAIKDCGFGYDSSTDDYKIVTLSVWYHEGKLCNDHVDTYLTVYSLRNNSWKKLQGEFLGLFVDLPDVVVNKSFNWLQNFSNLVSFSFTSEGFNDFRMQLYDGQFFRIYNMVDSGGKLGAFIGKGNVYEQWVMEDNGTVDNSSWTRVCFHEFEDYNVNTVVCCVEGSNRDIILDGKGGDVCIFNIDEKRWRNVKIEEGFGGFYVLGTYAESLESPKRFLRPP